MRCMIKVKPEYNITTVSFQKGSTARLSSVLRSFSRDIPAFRSVMAMRFMNGRANSAKKHGAHPVDTKKHGAHPVDSAVGTAGPDLSSSFSEGSQIQRPSANFLM